MPYHVTIIHAREFLKMSVEGTLDYEGIRRQLLPFAAIVNAHPDSEILLDTRTAHSTLSVKNFWDLVVEFRQQLSAIERKIAVLCPRNRFEHVKLLELCSQNGGLNVLAFTSYEEAMDWLFPTAEVS